MVMKLIFYSLSLFLLLTLLEGVSNDRKSILSEHNIYSKWYLGLNQKLKKITVIDTIIGKNLYKVNWFNNGIIRFEMNNNAYDSIKWFPYDDLAEKENHKCIILPSKMKAEKFLITKSKVFFSIVDFKGRAVLFNLNILKNNRIFFSKDTHNNPIIRESRYIYINAKKNLIIDNGGNHKFGDGLISKSYDIYEYTIDEDIKLKKTYQIKVKNRQPKKRLDLVNLNDVLYFYNKIDK
jgi:hypothetical protein